MINSNEKLPKFTIIYTDNKVTKNVARTIRQRTVGKYINNKRVDAHYKSWKKYDPEVEDNNVSAYDSALAVGNKYAENFITDHKVVELYNKFGVHIKMNGTDCSIYLSDIPDNEFETLETIMKESRQEQTLVNDIVLYSGSTVAAIASLSAGLGSISIAFLYKYISKRKIKRALQYSYAIDVFDKELLQKSIFPILVEKIEPQNTNKTDELSDL